MPKPAHARVTYSGTLSGGEIWAVNFNLHQVEPGTDSELDAQAASARSAWISGLFTLFTPDVVLTETRWAIIGADGHYTTREDGSYQVGINASPQSNVVATATNGVQARSTALCVSLLSARAGATGKGRIFLPWPATISMGADGRISASDAALVAGKAKTTINALNAIRPVSKVSVVSSKNYASQVVSVKVGRVPDTMRSRRNALVEDYQTVAL